MGAPKRAVKKAGKAVGKAAEGLGKVAVKPFEKLDDMIDKSAEGFKAGTDHAKKTASKQIYKDSYRNARDAEAAAKKQNKELLSDTKKKAINFSAQQRLVQDDEKQRKTLGLGARRDTLLNGVAGVRGQAKIGRKTLLGS